jgi:transmembrane sensor
MVAQLNRYSTTRLVIGDPKLASLTIGGRFGIGDLDALLEFLRTTFGIRARQVDDGTIRLES